MWIDERGSEVVEVPECRQLLAIGAARRLPGHLAVSGVEGDAPTVLPVDYAVDWPDAVVRVGEGLFAEVVGKLVALEVDAPDDDPPWSVLVRGLAREECDPGRLAAMPSPRVDVPGGRLVRVRSDVVTGRRLRARSRSGPAA